MGWPLGHPLQPAPPLLLLIVSERGRGMAGRLSREQWVLFDRLFPLLSSWVEKRHSVLWVTLTSAPDSGDLREHWRTLRRRVVREFGEFSFVAVETSEGHGVLHMFWAFPRKTKRSAPLQVPWAWLRDNWQGIHGAWNVWVRRVRYGDDSAVKLAMYAVTQYAAGQSRFVRATMSRHLGCGVSLIELQTRVRQELADIRWPLPHLATYADRRRVLTELLIRGYATYSGWRVSVAQGVVSKRRCE